MTRLGAAVALALLAGAAAAPAEDWSQWRGPRADGTSLERGLPTSWDAQKGVCWSTELPGQGHSSPIAARGSVFVTTALGDGHERALVRLDAASGRILWVRTVVRSGDLEALHPENSHDSSTPATDGRVVYTSFYASGRTHLAALDYDGKILWTAAPLRYRSEHGYHHNPLLLGDLLVLSFDQLAEAAVLGLDARTGQTRWRVPLANDEPSNVAPLPVESEGRTLVMTSGNDVTRALDPRDGKVVWRAAGPTKYCVAGLAQGGGVVFVNGGYPDRRSLAFKVASDEGATRERVAWESRKGTTYVPSPVFHDGHFYAVNDGGLATCWSARSGDVVWQERLPGRFRSSLVLGEGRLYATNDEGTTTVFRATPAGYAPVSTNRLREFVYATPALSGGRIFIRTKSRLHALGDCADKPAAAAMSR